MSNIVLGKSKKMLLTRSLKEKKEFHTQFGIVDCE